VESRPQSRLAAGTYAEVLNTDGGHYGGSGVGNGPLEAQPFGAHDKPFSIVLTLPPLATVMLRRTNGATTAAPA
jgi:1,4-alpha-glucan branching enzyme